MAETAAQIESRLRTQYPTIKVTNNGVDRTLTQAEYDAKIAEWVAASLAHQDEAVATDAERTKRAQARALYQALIDGTATNRQVQTAVAYLIRSLFGDRETDIILS